MSSRRDFPSGYEGLRVGFTAAVSHELRTPLARLLSLLDTAKLPGVDVDELIEEACAEVVEMTQLVDDILFLSELEQGREVVALGFTELAPYVDELFEVSRERALRAELALESDVQAGLVVPLRPRMLQVLLGNLLDNAVRYAGRGATFRISAVREGSRSCSTSRMTAPGWMPRTSRACSSASSAPTARARRAAPGSGSRSSSTSSPRPTARPRWRAHRARARASASCCPRPGMRASSSGGACTSLELVSE